MRFSFQATKFKAFFLFFGINLFLCIFTFFLLPETKGVKLEEMDVLFGGVDHRVAGADIMGAQSTFSNDKQTDEQRENAIPSLDATARRDADQKA